MSLDRWDSRSLVRVLGWALRDTTIGALRGLLSRLHSGLSCFWPFLLPARLSWWLGFWCVAGALVMGTVCATRWLVAEYVYTQGMREQNMPESIMLLRRAGALWPFERRFREASARKLAHGALATNTAPWRLAAIAELRHALTMSKNSADLLAILVTLELAQGLDGEAQGHFENFRAVARKSQFLELAESLRTTGRGMALH